MTLVLLAVTPILAVVGTAVAVVLGRMDTRANAAYATANGIVQECLANVRTVVAFNGQKESVRRLVPCKPWRQAFVTAAVSRSLTAHK